ncbi:MAG: S-layer homology domain-containing protein [Bacillota bacterium]|nr:S-layer homology domain-containing protein [Bacillota bacterium]
MKKNTKRLLGILLAAALLGGVLGFTALAGNDDPAVIFNASTKQFTIKGMAITKGENGVQNYYPDLFPNMKGMMPGDTVTQTINVKVTNAAGKTVKLYLRADNFTVGEGQEAVTYQQPDVENELPVSENGSLTYKDPADPTNNHYDKLFTKSEEVPHPATLTVQYSGKDTAGKDVTKSTDGTLADGVVELGTFSSDGNKEITVTFALPIEAGNEVADLTAKLGWVFVAEVTSNGGGGGTPGGGIEIPEEPVPGIDLNRTDHFAYIIGRPDGLVYPQDQITRGEVATIFFRMLTDETRDALWATTNPYTDVPSTMWCNNAISTLSHGGILKGYTDGSFQANGPITRAEFATMAVRFFEVSYNGPDQFSDISGHWARDYINSAAATGLIQGFEDGTFRPSQAITRAEAITIVNRVLERHPDKEHLLDDMIKWPDNSNPNAWYYADVQEATNGHDYEFKYNDANEVYEVWTQLQPVRDWLALEKTWATANEVRNQVEVYTSATALKP